ncbi:lipid II:glycine glycyltransferase FemX [Propionibacteriaceae bacterium Y1700]|uniref:lipid II:glycine glycyltransferase FemX n=1 Tax=Microlunatus sp. Y1700 TaxID=3418487 RepID=UPI003DA6D5AD
MTITVRTITPEEHLAFIEDRGHASFLQTPAWAQVKTEWRHESLGWYEGDTIVGAALVLYRQLPKVKRYLAYLPDGPLLDWDNIEHLGQYLTPMASHVKNAGAFAVRIGPTIIHRRWDAAAIKAAVADENVDSLLTVPPTQTNQNAVRTINGLRALGWIPPKEAEGFAAGQPAYNFWLPLEGKTPEDVLKGMNQQWRRNIKKATKAGVEVTSGGRDDLAAFHALYLETAERDGFGPRPLPYFHTMWDALTAEDPDRIRVYLAHHEGDLVASTLWIRVGTHAWYSYGASSTAKRDVRGSNAIQWRMITDAMEAGAEVYDLRGVTPGVGADDPELGLIQFKVGTGGGIVEYLGEWDLPLRPLLHKAFDLYMRRRG